ncbi:MAG: hypothetical protein ACJZ19_04260 [Candidatus Neomarinimicrobiota bacterium]
MKNIFFIILTINCFSVANSQDDFSLIDLNPSSDTFDQLIGPSYFSNNIIVIGFFHEY